MAATERARKRHTAGRPTQNFEVRLVDDDDREVPVGEVGEIVVRPKQPDVIFLSYWRQPEATPRAALLDTFTPKRLPVSQGR